MAGTDSSTFHRGVRKDLNSGIMLELLTYVKKRVGIYCVMLFILFLMSCAATSKINKPVPPKPVSGISTSKVEARVESKQQKVNTTAKSFLGSPYKYGGTTENGFDCSGLVYCSFQSVGLSLPRSSRSQANAGVEVDRKNIKSGDIIFFAQPGGEISHSGIVEKVFKDNILFIHSSSSKGVIISSINEAYWKKRFVKAVRIIE